MDVSCGTRREAVYELLKLEVSIDDTTSLGVANRNSKILSVPKLLCYVSYRGNQATDGDKAVRTSAGTQQRNPFLIRAPCQ